MPDRIQAIKILNEHLQALIGLRDRMEADHVGRANVERRIAEAEAAIAAERAAMEAEA